MHINITEINNKILSLCKDRDNGNMESNINLGRGFLPYIDPIITGSGSNIFEKLNDYASILPEYMQGKNNDIDYFDVQECKKLVDCDNLPMSIRAYAVVTSLAHGYIVHTGGDRDLNSTVKVPISLSKCLLDLSESLGRLPTQTYETYILQNYKLHNPDKGYTLPNIKALATYTGTKQEEWFIKVHVVSEHLGGKVLRELNSVQKSITNFKEEDYNSNMKASLDKATGYMEDLNKHLFTMNDGISGEEFFFNLRPYLKAWDGGVKYESDSAIFPGEVVWRGASGAQSSILPAIDRMMGLNVTQLDTMKDMYNYMPPEHKLYLDKLERGNKIKDFVKESGDRELVLSYNTFVHSIKEFREIHYKAIIDKYILPNIVKIIATGIHKSVEDEIGLLGDNKNIEKYSWISLEATKKIVHTLFSGLKSYIVKNKPEDLGPDNNDSKENIKQITDYSINLLVKDCVITDEVKEPFIRHKKFIEDQCYNVKKALSADHNEVNNVYQDQFVLSQLLNIANGAVGMNVLGTGGTDFSLFLQDNILMTEKEILMDTKAMHDEL